MQSPRSALKNLRNECKLWLGGLAIAGLLGSALWAGENSEPPEVYRIDLPQFPEQDLSGEIGARLLKLASLQVERNLDYIEQQVGKAGTWAQRLSAFQRAERAYYRYHLGGTACAIGVLTRFGADSKTMAGHSRQELESMGADMIKGVLTTHPLAGAKAEWDLFANLRDCYLLGMGAWLLWPHLDTPTQQLTAQVLAHEADRGLKLPVGGQLHEDTLAESHAWTGGGLAVAACMLKHHPRREAWNEKAKVFMFTAYATPEDTKRTDVLDGKPIRDWNRGCANAFPDYMVENHGIVHPTYMGAVSEMVRAAIAYKLANESIPKAVTFNAEKVFDALLLLLLPDGTHLHPQGTDYTPRRLCGHLQACNITPLAPTPLREACFIRSLESLEKVARDRPQLPLSGWPGPMPGLGPTWGLTENYLMRRLFGGARQPLPDEQIEAELAAVHYSEMGRFALHRTPDAISCFSWHPRGMLGQTMPLTRDVLCCPMPGNYIGEVSDSAAALMGGQTGTCRKSKEISVVASLHWCNGKVRQNCAFVTLPNGWSVYCEERVALADVELQSAISGTVRWYDDVRWHYQDKPRLYTGMGGQLNPSNSEWQAGNWVNVDQRLGYAALGAQNFRLKRFPGHPGIYREKNSDMFDTCGLAFKPEMKASASKEWPFAAKDRISRFALITLPNQPASETEALARQLASAGWAADRPETLAILVKKWVVYANFSAEGRQIQVAGKSFTLEPKSAGWVER